MFGAFVDGALQGIAALGRFTATKTAHKGFLWGMYVAEHARGRGLADQLTDAVLAHARSEGLRIVQLSCVTTNERARRIYERHGFIVYGIERSALRSGDTFHDELLMAVDLG